MFVLFIYFFILLIFLPPLFLSTFFNFLSSVLYLHCLLLSSRVLIFILRPFFWLFLPFHSFLPCCPLPSFFLSSYSTFISALWCASFDFLSTASPFLQLLTSTVNIFLVPPHSPTHLTKDRCTRRYPIPDGGWWTAPVSRRDVLLYTCAYHQNQTGCFGADRSVRPQ
jgi:hypothetical protein